MRQLQPVLWTKGVLLTPQHLQTQDRFLEDLIQFQLSALTFFPWGFHRLEIDHEELAGGVLAVRSAAGIFPDGLLFDMPESDGTPPPKQLEECWDPDRPTLDVYLAVPEYRYGGFNVSSKVHDGNTRFSADVLLRRDENTGLAEKPIHIAKKNFRLLVEGESIEGNSALRVARVTRQPTGAFELDAHFVPPLIDIAASQYLLAISRRLVEILTAKSSAIAERRRQKNQSLAEFGISDIANFWLLYTVNTYLPLLRHLFEARSSHPGELYEIMLLLGGALTTFSSRIQPHDLPSYDHSDLSGCFTKLDEQLRELLETVVPSRFVSLPMRLVEPSIYATALDQDRYLKAPALYLALRSDLDHAHTAGKAPQLVKVSSADRVNRLIKQALVGVHLTYVERPPSALPVKLDYHYFQLDPSGPEWDGITLARNLAAYVPSDFGNVQLELVVMLPPDEK